MANKVFRDKSIEKVTSPEQLNDYIKVNYLEVWFIIATVIIFLIVIGVWGFTGTINNTVEGEAYSDGKKIYCYMNENQVKNVEEGQKGRVDGHAIKVESVAELPDNYEDMVKFIGNEKIIRAMEIKGNEWRYLVVLSPGDDIDGVVDISITTDSVAPIDYLLN